MVLNEMLHHGGAASVCLVYRYRVIIWLSVWVFTLVLDLQGISPIKRKGMKTILQHVLTNS